MPHQGELLKAIDRTRKRAGFLSFDELLALEDGGNVIFDPFSTLISCRAVIGTLNVFHPNIRADCHGSATLHIGSGNVFHSNTVIEAVANDITIGDGNLFGEGAVCMKANSPCAAIEIGDNGRYCGIVNLFGKTTLGSGSQILGNITAYDCALAAGQPYSHPIADERGAVLKGSGSAKAIQLSKGQVIDGWGVFRAENAVLQSTFHP
ncbi:MAG: hypothetical protein ACFCUT_03335 [Kiloniellaceae bacterium]